MIVIAIFAGIFQIRRYVLIAGLLCKWDNRLDLTGGPVYYAPALEPRRSRQTRLSRGSRRAVGGSCRKRHRLPPPLKNAFAVDERKANVRLRVTVISIIYQSSVSF